MQLQTVAFCAVLTVVYSQCGSDDCELPSVCPKIISRVQWGARKSTAVNYAIIPVNFTIIHHTATGDCGSKSECFDLLRSIQNYHMDVTDYGDIGYNFLIGGDGNVYEGCGWHIIGAHTYGYNSQSISIAYIGNYIDKYPTLSQIKAGQNLISCAVSLGELYPDYQLFGARQLSATASPGNKLFREIQTWPNWSDKKPIPSKAQRVNIKLD